MPMPFIWWRANGDGTAEPVTESPEVLARINSGGRSWYATIEGAIIHGGVIATAFKRIEEPVFDTAHWLATRELKGTGRRVTIRITAEPVCFKAQPPAPFETAED